MNFLHSLRAQGTASIAAILLALPAVNLAATGTGDGSSAANAIDIASSDIADTSSAYWDDPNSLWSINGSLYYANSGNLNFGTTSSGDDLAIGYSTTANFLTISADTVTDYQGFVGYSSDSTGTVTVTGASSYWTNSDKLHVGYSGTGTLNIEDGGDVSNTYGLIGYSGTGTVTVTGAGSYWENKEELYVGFYGTGTLNIADGGLVSTSTSSYIGFYSGSNGTVTVTGGGSTWINSLYNLHVGVGGTGTLTISAGGTVTDKQGIIGENSGGNGTVIVTGTGSSWSNGENLHVGSSGTGTLTISAGGTVSNAYSYVGGESCTIGEYAGGNGTVTVTGAGSVFYNTSSLIVGGAGTGKLYIKDSALVIATTVSVGSSGAIYLKGGYLALQSADATTDLATLNALLDGGTSIYAWNGTTYELITSSLSGLISCKYYGSITECAALSSYTTLSGGYTVLTSTYSVPEPATYALFGGLGALAVALVRRKRS